MYHSVSTGILLDVVIICLRQFQSKYHLTLSDVSELLSKMTIKSCPLDPVPASVLKQCTSVLLPVMTQIVNQSLCLAVFQTVLNLHC